jgi:hypothetical protein
MAEVQKCSNTSLKQRIDDKHANSGVIEQLISFHIFHIFLPNMEQ